jgi:hypothetical protein
MLDFFVLSHIEIKLTLYRAEKDNNTIRSYRIELETRHDCLHICQHVNCCTVHARYVDRVA